MGWTPSRAPTPPPDDPRGPRGSARLGGDDRRPRRPTPGQHAQRAERRGVALLHEVGPDHGLSVGARPRGPEGARGQQAATADGAAHRVLHPDRRARPGPVRGGRRDAARARRSRAARGAPSASSSSRAGRRSTKAIVRDARGRARRGRPAASPTSERPIRAGRAAFDPSGLRAPPRRCPRDPADDVGGLGRLRRDRPALQRPAAADDGRRPARRDARQPADRLRDGHRLPGRPRELGRLSDVPRPDGGGLRGDGPRPAPGPVCRGHRP